MPPRAARALPLKVGDKVSVAVRQFGEEYARERAGRRWASDEVRDDGVVIERQDGKYLIKFADDNETHLFARKVLQLVERGAAAALAAAPAPPVVESSSGEGDSSEDEGGRGGLPSSDDDDGGGVNNQMEWVRNDEQNIDERSKHGWHMRHDPTWVKWPEKCKTARDEDDVSSYFFDVCLSWLPEGFFREMADEMQSKGRSKGTHWASWKVSMEDLWQWVGVWFYMLAFEEQGERRAYFQGCQRFGPRHVVEEYILRGKNGRKGVKWFENMLTCFTLPTGSVPESDPFHATRYMWECCRKHFVECVSPGWLITLDESMVKWKGRAMPGLMVVPRKPTPVGLEVHTLCCSLSGILVNFEIFEGKEAMEKKELVNQKTDAGIINKSTALTLRCTKPYFSSVRVVACF